MSDLFQVLALMMVPVAYFLTIRTLIRRQNRAAGFDRGSEEGVLLRQAALGECAERERLCIAETFALGAFPELGLTAENSFL